MQQLPSNVRAESSILGAVILDNSLAPELAALRRDDFLLEFHKKTYDAIRELHERGEKIDTITLASVMKSTPREIVEISNLTDNIPRLENLDAYSRIVREKATLRRILAVANRISEGIYSGEKSLDEVLALGSNLVEQGEGVLDDDATMDAEGIAEELAGYFQSRARSLAEGNRPFFETPWDDLNWALGGGFHKKNLVILQARPSSGKSSLSLAMALRASMYDPTLYVTMEMSRVEMALKMLAFDTLLETHRINHVMSLPFGELRGDQPTNRGEIVSALTGLKEKYPHLMISEGFSLTVEQMIALVRSRGAKLVFVDQLSEFEPSRSGMTEYEHFTHVVKTLKRAARRYDLCIVLMSQRRRVMKGVKQRDEDVSPELGDGKGSGAIEEKADVLLAAQRPFKHDPPDERGCERIFLHIVKQRMGRAGVPVELLFHRATTAVFDLPD